MAGEQEANLLKCNYLGTEHILLGMLSTNNDVTRRACESWGEVRVSPGSSESVRLGLREM